MKNLLEARGRQAFGGYQQAFAPTEGGVLAPAQVEFQVHCEAKPETFDRDKRTFEILLYGGAKVIRQTFFGPPFEMQLSLKPEHVRMERMKSGRAPFLNNHRTFSLFSQIGIIEAASLGSDGLKATVRLSKREEVDAIAAEIEDGQFGNTSVGTFIHSRKDVTKKSDQFTQILVDDWEPFEGSLVPIGADPTAQVLHLSQDPTSSTRTIFLFPATEALSMKKTDKEAAAELADTGTTTAEAKATDEQLKTAREEARKAERERCALIRKECKRVGKAELADQFIADELEEDEFRAKLLDALATESEEDAETSGTFEVGKGPREDLQTAAVEVMMFRGGYVTDVTLSDQGQEIAGMSFLRLTEEILEREKPGCTRGKSPTDICNLAFHSTSDFPAIVANVMNKTLRKGYDETPQTFRPFTRPRQVNDFKPIQVTQLGEAPSLIEVPEGATITEGTIGEGKETYQLASFNRIFSVTRRLIINDDLDALSRMPFMFGAAANRLESDLVWALITGNVVLTNDGIALFHASHGNIATGAISIAALGSAREKMRLQKGVNGEARLNIDPQYLIVPPALETVAAQFTTQITPNEAAKANVFVGQFQQVITEARLQDVSAAKWYMAASPGQIDVLELATLAGAPVPRIDSRIGFDVEGMRFSAGHDAAAAAIDFRGLVESTGV